MTSFASREAMTTAEQTEDKLMLFLSIYYTDNKLFSTMSDVCEAIA